MKINKRTCVFIVVFLVLGFIIPLLLYSATAPNQDESYYVLVSGDFASGKGIPYKDFASDPKPPGIYYALTPLFLLTGPSIFAGRILVFLINIITAILIYKTSERFAKGAGKISALLYLIAMLLTAYEGFSILTEPFMALFLLAAVYFALSQKDVKGKFLAGIFGGVSFLFKQPGAVFLLFLLAYLILEVRNKKLKHISAIKQLATGVLGFLLPIGLAFYHFYSLGAFPELISWIFTVPSKFMPSFFGIFSVAGAFHVLSFGVVFFIALLQMAKTLDMKDSKTFSLLLLGVISLFPWIAIQFGHYLLPSISVACILAGAFLSKNRSKIKSYITLAIIILLLVVTFSVDLYSGLNFQRNSGIRNQSLNDIVQYLKSQTQQNENIFVFGYDPAIYLLSERRPPFRSYHVLSHLLGDKEDDINQKLMEKVNLIVKVTNCELNQKICDFIYQNYIHNTTVGKYDVFIKRELTV